jgi:sulfatase modifying factor 1
MRALGFALAVLTAACSAQRCKDGTLFLSYALINGAETADTIDVTLRIGDGEAQTRTVSRTTRAASIEVDFGAYPEGQLLAVTVTARAGENVLASASQTTTATTSCTVLSFALDRNAGDLGESDLAGIDGGLDLANGSDLAASSDMVFVPGPSCTNLASNCGASGGDSCCNSPVVSGGTFKRSYDGIPDAGYEDPNSPATVSDFRLNKYEVTVGRFRKFVNAGMGTQANPPPATAGANPYISNSGWDPNWSASLTVDTAAFIGALKCDMTSQTWTDAPGANENRPINCVDWFEAFAFCAWDGSFLPTEAERNYVASGGSEQRAYPWSNPPSALIIDNSYAVYNSSSVALVGSTSPKGDGKWGHSDLAGNVLEWTLDWFANYANPCVDCANLIAASERAIRGGSWFDGAPNLRTPLRVHGGPTIRNVFAGIRCARTK